MIEKITELFSNAQNNQILIAIMGGGIFWQIISNIQAILGTIWSWILACISFTINSVNVGDYDRPILRYKIEKVLSNSKVLWERHSELQPTSSDYNETKLMNTAFGRSYRWLWGHFMILDRTYSTQSTKVVINISARVFFTRRKKFIARLIEEVEKCSLTGDRDTIMVNMGDGIVTEKPKRDINSVYTDGNIAQKMLSDVKAFIDNRDIYVKNNSPYKFVGLLCGTPGSGKTSTIHAIASELGMGIRFINTDKEEFESIARLMTRNDDYGDNGKRNIIVIEDIDCMSMNATDRRNISNVQCDGRMKIEDDDPSDVIEYKNEHNRSLIDFKVAPISLSSILNLLDGIITPSGAIVFLTTNNPDKLDSALLRDGRIDARYDFSNFSRETARRMVKDHLGFDFVNIADKIVPSSLQRDILKVTIGRLSKDDFVDKYSDSQG